MPARSPHTVQTAFPVMLLMVQQIETTVICMRATKEAFWCELGGAAPFQSKSMHCQVDPLQVRKGRTALYAVQCSVNAALCNLA